MKDRYVVAESFEWQNYILLLHFASTPIGKEFNMNLALDVDLGNAGYSHEPLVKQRQMAVLRLPYGKPSFANTSFTNNCLLQS